MWHLCSPDDVYPNGDKSAPPDVTVLADVIEKSERSMITHGVLDFVLLHQGTLLAINNLTWAGELGFQEEPTGKFMVQGEEAGLTHTERGLTWTQVERSGRASSDSTTL